MRLGVIVSVIWFLGWGGHAWFGSMLELEEQYSTYLKGCSMILDEDENKPLYDYCIHDVTEFYRSRFEDYKKQIPSLLAVDFGTLFIAWTLPLLGIAIVRGVKWMLFLLLRDDKDLTASAPSVVEPQGQLLGREEPLPWARPSAIRTPVELEPPDPAAQIRYPSPKNRSRFGAAKSALPILRPSRAYIGEAPLVPKAPADTGVLQLRLPRL
jgi:hypothetical protein